MFKLGTPVDFPGRLMRSSLGQSANIGDLYDATTDRFTGQSVITGSTEHLAVKATPMESPAEECILDDILYDGLLSLVNEKELKLSVAVGMVEDINMSPMHGVFLRTLATLREEVKSITDIKRLVSSHDTTVSERATHVVVGVVWGATVAVCVDRNDSDVQSKSSMDGSSPDLQTMMSVLKYGALPNSQVLSDINNVYTIRCFSNCLPQDTQQCRTSLEDALAMLSNLPRLIHSANNGKGARLSFILMPLSLLTDRTASMPVRIEDSLLTKTLALFREVTETKHKYAFAILSQYIDGHKNYLQKQELGKIDEFLAGFQHAQKKLYDDVARAVVAVRSGRLDQSRLDDILHAFSHGLYSVDSVTAFCNRLEPTLQRLEFFDELIHEGIVIIGNSRTDLRAITRDPDVYILYATEGAKRQHPRLWEENSSAFLDIARQEKRKREKRRGNRSASTFAYIDCDIVHAANVGTEIAIYHYKHDQVVSRDVAAERAVIASLNIAESSQEKQQFRSRPAKLAVVEMACPGASSKCDSSQRVWSCEVCKEDIEYGFDDYFYCSCGRALVNTFCYKCNGSYHSDDYLTFPPRVVKEHVRNLKPIRELNILFLGETGVGKSTWINGFANYISYSTLSEAENGDDVCLIPTKFTMMDENYEEVEINTGTDKNEDQQVGQSSTQMPKTYVFRHKKCVIRIIDTPGVGDTRGIDQDIIKFQNLMTHISKLDEINGICFLLKPNNSRLTVMFEFCIKELLTHLHRDACKNIVFCFTNARGTFYKPGNTLPALRQLIANNIKSTNIDVRLCKETLYCIDNESVRFLAALKQGIKFEEKEKNNYATSWEISVRETDRLIDYISSLTPHKVKNTLSLNDARRLILELSRPLAEISSTIQNNIGVVDQRRLEVEESKKHKKDLSNNLYIPAIDLETAHMDHPRTVCTANKCVNHISVGGVKKIDYVKHCHPHCTLTGVQTDIINCVALQNCLAMVDKSHCKHCGCSWSMHMHITYETKQVPIKVEDGNVKKQIEDKASKIQIIERHLQSLQERINKLDVEKCVVAKVSAKIACFLKHNAMAPYNDVTLDYLEHLIEVEKGKVGAGGDRSVLTRLVKMKSMYEEEVTILEEEISDQTSSVRVPTGEDIKKLYDDLCRLEITGPMLKKTMQVAEASDVAAMQRNEERSQPHRKPLRKTGTESPAL